MLDVEKTDKRKVEGFYSKLGKKGGKARALALSPRKRKQIAKKAAKARWGKLHYLTK
jgi:general stress protein YciG